MDTPNDSYIHRSKTKGKKTPAHIGSIPHNPELLYGLTEIAAYMGRGKRTVQNWWLHNGFPMSRDPGGFWVTTRTLINDWIRMRHFYQLAQEKHKRGEEVPDELKRLFQPGDEKYGRTKQ